MAYALAILAADDIPHPALEAVFTVGEEVGLTGATALDASDLTGKILMNMDSENDGISDRMRWCGYGGLLFTG